jgi:hypothetical protein
LILTLISAENLLAISTRYRSRTCRRRRHTRKIKFWFCVIVPNSSLHLYRLLNLCQLDLKHIYYFDKFCQKEVFDFKHRAMFQSLDQQGGLWTAEAGEFKVWKHFSIYYYLKHIDVHSATHA